MAWKPGTRLNQYRIDRLLGSDGFGITDKAGSESFGSLSVFPIDELH